MYVKKKSNQNKKITNMFCSSPTNIKHEMTSIQSKNHNKGN